MNKKNPELTGRTYLIFAGILLVCMLISVKMGIEYQKSVNAALNFTGTPHLSGLTKENAVSYCEAHGYDAHMGWMACGIDAGFTCTKTNPDGFSKHDCFSLQELYNWQYQR